MHRLSYATLWKLRAFLWEWTSAFLGLLVDLSGCLCDFLTDLGDPLDKLLVTSLLGLLAGCINVLASFLQVLAGPLCCLLRLCAHVSLRVVNGIRSDCFLIQVTDQPTLETYSVVMPRFHRTWHILT